MKVVVTATIDLTIPEGWEIAEQRYPNPGEYYLWVDGRVQKGFGQECETDLYNSWGFDKSHYFILRRKLFKVVKFRHTGEYRCPKPGEWFARSSQAVPYMQAPYHVASNFPEYIVTRTETYE